MVMWLLSSAASVAMVSKLLEHGSALFKHGHIGHLVGDALCIQCIVFDIKDAVEQQLVNNDVFCLWLVGLPPLSHWRWR